MDKKILKQCWFLAGPTASGKSSAAILIAKTVGAEIISLDSMAIYREMNIGTAKPSEEELSEVPHHQINIVSPTEDYSLAEFISEVEKISGDILDRNKIPLFTGGTGLYLRAVLRGLFNGPSADWDFRNKLEEKANREGNEVLLQELMEIDPQTASKFHHNDQRRVIRALEVYHLTGIPLSEQQNQEPIPESERPEKNFWLQPSRKKLYQKIDNRVIQMFESGLIEEVKSLLEKYENISRTARQALGYKEVIDFLEKGSSENNLEDVIDLIQTRTRQFAKRQHTWFRNLKECKPLDLSGNESSEEVARIYLDQN